LGESKGVFNADDTDLLPCGTDKADLRDADALIDARLVDGCS